MTQMQTISESDYELNIANSFILFLLKGLSISTKDPNTIATAIEIWKKSLIEHMKNDKTIIKEFTSKTGDSDDVAKIILDAHTEIYIDIINNYIKKLEIMLNEK